MKPLFSLAILSLLSLNVHAGVHKWVDADGKVQYSDAKPNEDTETQQVRNVAGKEPSNAPASYTPKSYAEREAEMKKAKLAKEEESKKKAAQDANAEAKKKNCAAARENARTLAESPRVVTYDSNGEKTYMDDSTRAQRLEESRRQISENCN